MNEYVDCRLGYEKDMKLNGKREKKFWETSGYINREGHEERKGMYFPQISLIFAECFCVYLRYLREIKYIS